MKHIVVAGAGRWGRNIVRNMHELGFLGAVCDPSNDAKQWVQNELPGVRFEKNLELLLRDEQFKGVAVATPAPTHRAVAAQVLESGRHAMVEKPLCLTAKEGQELVDLASQHQRVLMVGHVLEYHPAVVRLHQLIREGTLGDVFYVYSNRLNLGTIRTEENVLWSFAPHDIAVILRLIGAQPAQVSATGGFYLQKSVADMTVTHLTFPSGVVAHIHVSWLHPFKEQRLVVIGSKAMASFDDVSKQLTFYDRRGEIDQGVPRITKGDGEVLDVGGAEPLREECQAFASAIQSGHPPLTDGESGVRVLKVLEAAQRSLESGGTPVSMGQ